MLLHLLEFGIYISLLNNIVFPSSTTKLNNELQFTVFPNPASNKLFVEYAYHKNIQNTKAIIYSLDGRIISQSTLQQNIVDITSLSKGNFILELQEGRNKFVQYFTKQ